MSEIIINNYTEGNEKWDNFIDESINGTIFHKLQFLSYHKKKFEYTQNLVWLKGQEVFAVMPMAIIYKDKKKIALSPYGASFGGVVFSKKYKLRHSVKVVKGLVDYLKKENINECYIKLMPIPYYSIYSGYLEFCLSSNGFNVVSRDVFNVIRLHKNIEDVWNNFEGRSRTAIRKYTNNFIILNDVTVEEFYPILKEDKERHGNATITHTLEELKYLKEMFPKEIQFDVAVHKETKAKVGICYFRCNKNTIMTFYMAQENKAVGLNGKNVLINNGIVHAINEGFRYFDFGASTIGYSIQNIGVAEFKESFGALGYLRDTFIWKNE